MRFHRKSKIKFFAYKKWQSRIRKLNKRYNSIGIQRNSNPKDNFKLFDANEYPHTFGIGAAGTLNVGVTVFCRNGQ